MQKLSFMTSIRLDRAHHEWVKAFGDQYGLKPSQVYREIIKNFIRSKQAA